MKKLILLFILLTLLLSGCGIFNLDGWITPDDAEFLALIQELDTPCKICQYMIDNFTYKENTSYNPNPYELWLIQEGDCNDFATFGIFIANYNGYETYQIRIFYPNDFNKHLIAVYKENKYSFSDNQIYFIAIYNTFLEIVEYDCYLQNKVWSNYTVYDYEMNLIEQGTND